MQRGKPARRREQRSKGGGWNRLQRTSGSTAFKHAPYCCTCTHDSKPVDKQKGAMIATAVLQEPPAALASAEQDLNPALNAAV
jgi:hypothetical protein